MKFLKIFILLLSLFNISYADRLKEIKEKGVIRIAVFEDKKYFSLKENSGFVGHEIDFARIIAMKLNATIEFVPISPKELVSVLTENRADLVVAMSIIMEDRKKNIDYSIPYYLSNIGILHLRSKAIDSEEVLHNSNLTFGILNDFYIKKILNEKYPKLKVNYYDTLVLALDALQNSEVDGVINFHQTLVAHLSSIEDVSEHVKLKMSKIRIGGDHFFGVGIPKGEESLRKEINKILLDMEELDEARIIYNRWFGYKSTSPIIRKFKIKEE